ncbi:3083_t:CDS:2 [Dentiscutata heterogama]|uniref:3083_t:CDS:1 n=1 Tax=Dentiscutata heterogama TaxID=1316150 RepID=A0ACA9ML98_9GLOM|nr:3083_t:CDS:2 [Dentiscutata heterogama]
MPLSDSESDINYNINERESDVESNINNINEKKSDVDYHYTGYQCGEKRIKVQVATTSKHKKGSSRELKKMPQRRPKKNNKNDIYEIEQQEEPSQFIIPA